DYLRSWRIVLLVREDYGNPAEGPARACAQLTANLRTATRGNGRACGSCQSISPRAGRPCAAPHAGIYSPASRRQWLTRLDLAWLSSASRSMGGFLEKTNGLLRRRVGVLSDIWTHRANRGSKIRAIADYLLWNAARFSMDARHVQSMPTGSEL